MKPPSMKMNPIWKDLWIKRLRCEEIDQGCGRLLADKPDGTLSLCAYGVLVEQLVCMGFGDIEVCSKGNLHFVDENNVRMVTLPTHTAYTRVGLIDGGWTRLRTSDGKSYTVTFLNDRMKLPLAKIADLIEAQL